MHRGRWLLALLLILVVGGSAAQAAAGERLNVLFFSVDDLKPAIGCYGDPLAKTPNLDRLAARGTLFERAYCMQAVCSPSRNGVLTGLRPQTLKIYDLATNFRKSVPNVVTLPEHFRKHGYQAEALGKIFHVGHGNHDDAESWSVPSWRAQGEAYALDESRVQQNKKGAGKAAGKAKQKQKQRKQQNRRTRGAPVEAADVDDEAYSDGKVAAEAIRRLRAARQSDQPFFLAVGFVKPHLPFCVPRKYWDLHDPMKLPMPTATSPPRVVPVFAPTNGGELRNYKGMPKQGPIDEATQRRLIHGYYAATSYMDAQLGRVLDELDRLELADKTVIVLWGDHGWHLGDHGMWCKHTNYEQATRAPLLFVSPGAPGKQRTADIVEFVDIYPTLCDLAGIERPAHLQGDSLAGVIRGEASAANASQQTDGFAMQVYPRGSDEAGPMLGHAVRNEHWRYVEWRANRDGKIVARELYDLANDPGETVNLAEDSKQAEVVAELAALVEKQLAKPDPEGLRDSL